MSLSIGIWGITQSFFFFLFSLHQCFPSQNAKGPLSESIWLLELQPPKPSALLAFFIYLFRLGCLDSIKRLIVEIRGGLHCCKSTERMANCRSSCRAVLRFSHPPSDVWREPGEAASSPPGCALRGGTEWKLQNNYHQGGLLFLLSWALTPLGRQNHGIRPSMWWDSAIWKESRIQIRCQLLSKWSHTCLCQVFWVGVCEIRHCIFESRDATGSHSRWVLQSKL